MKRDKDGKAIGTNREILRGYVRRLEAAGNDRTASLVRKAMAGAQCPVLLAHVWQWFGELSNAREWGDGGPQAIRPTEIAAWSQLTGERPNPREIRLILGLDVKFRNVHAESDDDTTTLPDADQEMLEWVKAAAMSNAC